MGFRQRERRPAAREMEVGKPEQNRTKDAKSRKFKEENTVRGQI